MSIDIDHLTFEELIELNRRVVERLRCLESVHAHMNMMAFNLGARVSFDTQGGRQIGTLVKYNRKTVTVVTDNGQRWNISPHLLSAVKDVTSGAPPDKRRIK